MLGVITGTFGGVLGDLMCNELPSLFTPNPLNATCSFTGAWVYLGLLHLRFENDIALLAGLGVIVAFRLASVKWNWSFPAVRERK